MILASVQARALQNSQSPAGAVRGGDGASIEPANCCRCSVLLTFGRINVLLANMDPRGVEPLIRPQTRSRHRTVKSGAEQIRHQAVV
jgi:hypothetical protein